MITTFKELCTELHLAKTYKNAEQAHELERWCNENISMDKHYVGSSPEQYKQYLALSQHYLDAFLPYIPANLTTSVPQFEHMTTIQYAAWHGYDRFIMTRNPIENEAIQQPNAAGMTPLHFSAAQGYVHTTQVLLAHGANPHQSNNESQRPIHSALFVPLFHDDALISNKETIFRMLIAAAPDAIKHQDNSGDTVFQLMAAHGFFALMAEMLSKDTTGALIGNHRSQYPIHTAILNNQLASADVLLKIEGVATLTDSKQRTALHYAARYGTSDMVQHCCEATRDLNLRDTRHNTPLLLAAEAGNIAAVQTLVHRGADATLVDSLGHSLLHVAVLARNHALVSWLLDHTPIDVNQIDAEGQTPLSLCQQDTDGTIANLLINKGATDSQ